MVQEKFPNDYDPSTLQKIYERLRQALSRQEKKQDDDLHDVTRDLSTKIKKSERRTLKRIQEHADEQFSVPFNLPLPQDLTVYELGIWGLANVDPFIRWKYMGKIKGYEFYGSPNSGFEPRDSTYAQIGTHYGTDNSAYLYTKDASDSTNDFVLDYRLIGRTIHNLTQETSGTILSYRVASPKYGLFASGVTWDNGDRWRIQLYPPNKLFNIGAFCTYPKRLGNYYIKARTVGTGHSYSPFTSEVGSIGWSSTVALDTPQIVYPVHYCGETCAMGSQDTADWGFPDCPIHGVVPWNEITDGTREVDHFLFFGIEWCNIELVWEAIETSQRGIWYDTRRGITSTEDPEIA